MSISSSNNDDLRRDLSSESSLSGFERLGHQHSCDSCEILTCDSIHGSLAANCLVKDCYFCTDIAIIDDEISGAYQRLFDLVQKRKQTIKKPHHETFIHRLPVEILSLIFIFVKQAYGDHSQGPSSYQPPTSPPLLVGAICKKWRDITLRTPRLWTDIIVDLGKPADAQLAMVNEWARRSCVLPVNIKVSLSMDYYEEEEDIPEGREDVAQALRSLAIRWNDVTLFVPWYFCHSLFGDLEESPTIASFHIFVTDDEFTVFDPIKLQHPVRPKRFYSYNISGIEIPVEWDSLVHLEIGKINDGRHVLDIIRHAQNLRHWDVMSKVSISYGEFPKAATYILNRSLIYFKTNIQIVHHLILPSLQHLNYSIGWTNFSSAEHLRSLSDFIERSYPPLQTFSLRCDLHAADPNPCFKKLPGITSLFITDYNRANGSVRMNHFLHDLTNPTAEVILPRLGELTLKLDYMSRSSWSLLSSLFQRDIQLDTPGLKDMKAFGTLGRPLSKVSIEVWNEDELDEDTFLHLLAVRKSGVELSLRGWQGVDDLFRKMAKNYNVDLEEVGNEET